MTDLARTDRRTDRDHRPRVLAGAAQARSWVCAEAQAAGHKLVVVAGGEE